MTENPYASPALTADELAADIKSRSRHGPLVMGALGLSLGTMIVGLTGGITAGLIVLPIALWEGSLGGIVLIANLGAMLAGTGGAIIGLIAGVIAGSARPRFRKSLLSITAIPTVLFALVCSLLLCGPMAEDYDSPWILLEIGYGLLVGLGGGTVGGVILGRVLARLAWGPPGSESKRPLNAREKYA